MKILTEVIILNVKECLLASVENLVSKHGFLKLMSHYFIIWNPYGWSVQKAIYLLVGKRLHTVAYTNIGAALGPGQSLLCPAVN